MHTDTRNNLESIDTALLTTILTDDGFATSPEDRNELRWYMARWAVKLDLIERMPSEQKDSTPGKQKEKKRKPSLSTEQLSDEIQSKLHQPPPEHLARIMKCCPYRGHSIPECSILKDQLCVRTNLSTYCPILFIYRLCSAQK